MQKIIAVDFDGTLCEEDYPKIGRPNYNLIEYLQEERKNNNVILILWTCRTYSEDIEEAVTWCQEHGLEFDYVNENAAEQIEKFGVDSRKIFADEYIEDKCRVGDDMMINEYDDATLGVRTSFDEMKYRGFVGTITYSEEDESYVGKLIRDPYDKEITDFVDYEADTIRNLKLEFKQAVDEYLDFCDEIEDKDPS